MSSEQISPDAKGEASLTFADVITQTTDNFPDPRFRPTGNFQSNFYRLYGFHTGKYHTWESADGIGTKPELAERLYSQTGDPKWFESLAYDTFAMVDGDVSRFGFFLLGITEILDRNQANNSAVTAALAKGAKRACNQGRFSLINGETAELGYRTSGYGDDRVNWNAVGKYLIVPNKRLSSENLKPNQPVVGFKETSSRSNGFTRFKNILDALYLHQHGFKDRRDYIAQNAGTFLGIDQSNPLFDQLNKLPDALSDWMGHDFLEQVLLPWHQDFPDVTKELLQPSTLYGPLMYQAQNGIDTKRNINLIAAAHITGGGIPLKGMRMVEAKGLGLKIDPVFPDPQSLKMLVDLAQVLPEEQTQKLIDDKDLCKQSNRGVGYLVVVENYNDVDLLVDLSVSMGFRAAPVGEVTKYPQIQFGNHIWTY